MSAQRWCKGLRPLANSVRSLHTSSSPAAALPALSDVQASAGGFFSKMFGGRPSRSLVPLTEALPNIESAFLDSPPSEAPKTELTTLGNGFKVATEATIVRSFSVHAYIWKQSAGGGLAESWLYVVGTNRYFRHLCRRWQCV